jgi:hypothetical protein
MSLFVLLHYNNYNENIFLILFVIIFQFVTEYKV